VQDLVVVWGGYGGAQGFVRCAGWGGL